MPRIFVAGPHGCPACGNLAAFTAAMTALDRAGHDPVRGFCAWQADADGSRRPVPMDWWREDCITELRTCDGVALLDGWEGSYGTVFEVGAAQALRIPYLPLGYWLDTSYAQHLERSAAAVEAAERLERALLQAIADRANR